MGNTLTKACIIDSETEQLEIPRKQSAEPVESLLELIKSTLESEEDVMISGFGKFCVNCKAQRRR